MGYSMPRASDSGGRSVIVLSCRAASRPGTACPPPAEHPCALHLPPVSALGGEDGRAADRLGGPVQRVGGGPPHRVVRGGPVSFQGRLVLVDVAEVAECLV